MALRENEVLKARLEAITSPISRFVNIEASYRAQIAAGAVDDTPDEESEAENTPTPEDCIVVASRGVRWSSMAHKRSLRIKCKGQVSASPGFEFNTGTAQMDQIASRLLISGS
jgi:hypothetical protein